MRIDLTIPTWDKITNEQLLFISRLFVKNVPLPMFRTLVFMKLTGLKMVNWRVKGKPGQQLFKFGKKFFYMRVETLALCLRKVDFIRNETGEVQPLKRVRRARPCDKRLYGAPFVQYFTAYNFYTAFLYTKDDTNLRYLTASLYLKPGHKFNDKKVKPRSRYFRRTKKEKLYTVFLWFRGFMEYLKKEYPYLYRETGSNVGAPNMKKYIENMLMGLSNNDITKEEEILDSPAHRALAQLNELARVNEQDKPKTKRHV